ncbi:SSBP4 protein, partial [Serilophus lunatus]|nr:SSBP4 protein [Serilophus lunatus]
RLALYVYEYLLHVGAQKSAQTFLSEIRWEKNITLGEPPGFLHSWWCVFWDLYCAAPDRRETCEHSSEAKAFHDYVSTTGAPSPGDPGVPWHSHPPLSPPPGGRALYPTPHPTVTSSPCPTPAGDPLPTKKGVLTPLGEHPPAPCPPFPQPPVGVPGSQPLLPNAMDPAARSQGHPGMGGPMQRMNPPRGMAGMGPQTYGSGMRPPPSSLAGPGMPTMNMGPGGRGPWPNPNANSVSFGGNILGVSWGRGGADPMPHPL